MNDAPDDLHELLAPRHAQAQDATLLATIQRRTARVFIRRKWVRRGESVTVCLALLAIGAIGGWIAKPSPIPGCEFVAVPVPIVLPPTEPPAPQPTEADITAEQYELKAEQATAVEAARLYKLAGERFEKQYDFAQATRCYRLYLLAAPNERVVSTDDSWLLISMKSSQHKETDHDAKQGS